MISKTECEKELWHAEHDTDQRFEERLLAGEITYFFQVCPEFPLHRGSEKARGFNPGMNQADDMF